ncbi:hypothetical protein [uncultured Kordia sp.]|uniref:hypothetical protein n=1 Tax=uncultured Kordia sp. TaxID=507699 RepID=UPI0026372B9F|nr:hypothetical protein [uncultured Kordia sp.]
MERFTNNKDEFFNQIKTELSTVKSPKGISPRFTYLEIPHFMTYGLSVSSFEKNATELFVKIWDADYDWNRFKTGVFNLDRLAIREHTIVLSQTESNQLNVLLAKKLDLVEFKGIMLDGFYCQFATKEKKINWNSDFEINNNLIKLVNFLKNKIDDFMKY